MAITFTTGTINQPDAGSVGLAMIEQLRDDLVLHSAWELVEEFTPASGLVRWYVFKCLAAQSGLSADYFVVIGRTLGDGSLRAFICENYNSSTKTVTNYAQGQTTLTAAYDSLGRGPASYILGTAVPTGATTTPKMTQWAPSGTSTKWWITVDNDGFAVAFNGASNGFFHCGAYIPLNVFPSLMPIGMIGNLNIGGNNDTGQLTRNPAAASITTKQAALHFRGGGGSSSNGTILGFPGRLDVNDKLQGDQRPVAEVGIHIAEETAGERVTYGWALGKQKRMRLGATPVPAGMIFGDAYVVQNRLWVPYLTTDERMWDTGVSAS